MTDPSSMGSGRIREGNLINGYIPNNCIPANFDIETNKKSKGTIN
jgi:hypothetical protein